jgi:hypothetical protein
VVENEFTGGRTAVANSGSGELRNLDFLDTMAACVMTQKVTASGAALPHLRRLSFSSGWFPI